MDKHVVLVMGMESWKSVAGDLQLQRAPLASPRLDLLPSRVRRLLYAIVAQITHILTWDREL